MALATYSDVVSAVGDWLERGDLETRIPTFIALTEAKLNRRLQDPEQEVTSTATAVGDYTALPEDFGEMVSVTTGEGPLQAMGPAEYASTLDTWVGTPRFYSIFDGGIALYPRNSTAAFTLVYRRTIPPLTEDNPTNWLLTRAPDVYLYGALVEASAWDVDGDKLPQWNTLFEAAVTSLMADGVRRRWGAGAIAPRIRRT